MALMTKIEPTVVSEKKKLRVAAYARVSTDSDEQLLSLEAQKTHYEIFIKSHADWEFVGLYYDEGISGTSMKKRTGLLRMLEDCDKEKIDLIITKSISRFSRNTLESIETVRKLRSIKIHMYFEKENIDTGRMDGELLLTILSSLAENESRTISTNQVWAVQKRFRSGSFTVGSPPYGYRNKNGEMVIDTNEAPVVKKIFSMAIDGYSSKEIAEELEEDDIPTRRGGKWNASCVNRMLRNITYTGDLILQKTYTDSSFKRHVNYKEKDKYYLSGHHEPIINMDTFEKVKALMEMSAESKNNKAGQGKHGKTSLFRKMIICGKCGNTWKRLKISGEFYYGCNTHFADKNACEMKSIREEAIMAAFVVMMNKLIAAREQILVRYSRDLTSLAKNNRSSEYAKLEIRLNEINQRRMQLKDFFGKSLLDPAIFASEMEALISEENQIKGKQETLNQQDVCSKSQKQSLKELLAFTASVEGLRSFVPDLFLRFVDHIVVYSREEIGFAMKCGPVFREVLKR